MTTTCTMILGDCLEVMPTLPKASVQLCFADVPYAPKHTHCTRNTWDKYFPFDLFWNSLWPTMYDAGQLLMSGNMRLVASVVGRWPRMFRYELVWQKALPVGFLDANRRPLRSHEMIAVMSERIGVYNPQKTPGKPYTRGSRRPTPNYDSYMAIATGSDGDRYPTSVVRVPQENKGRIHPTQKPVALLEWIVLTYSNAGDMVLDPTSGSGTTAVASASCSRNVTCIEKDDGYFEASVDRVRKHVRDNLLDVKIEVRR